MGSSQGRKGARAQRRKDVSGIFENTVLENFGFHNKKEFLRKLSEILARVLKKVRQFCPTQKKKNKYRFEGAPNYQTARGAHLPRTDPN